MKFLRILLFVLLGVLVLYVILCFLGPKKFATEKSISVAASSASIFEEISDFSRWPAWSPWEKYDTATKHTYSGEAGTIGHKNDWESSVTGNGSQTITELKPGESIRMELKFTDWDGVSYSDWKLTPSGDSTKVTWTMDGSEIPFMARGLMVLMGGQESIEKDYDLGLQSLKKLVEAKPKAPAFSYEIVDIPATNFISKRIKCNMKDDLSPLFGAAYSELSATIGGMDKIAGWPFSIGYSVNMETGDMELGIALPTAGEVKPGPGQETGVIPAGRCLKHVYYGAYDGTAPAWGQLGEVFEAEGFTERFPGYEIYANDPATVSDPSQYITWLMWPIN